LYHVLEYPCILYGIPFFIILEVAVYVLAMSLANSSSPLPESFSGQGSNKFLNFYTMLFKLDLFVRTGSYIKFYPFLKAREF
jgi:hypothetical protein